MLTNSEMYIYRVAPKK